MSLPWLFISDLHLSPERPHITEAFFSFLQQHSANTGKLFILGDLFDAWVGDDDDSELANEAAHRLKQFARAGPRVFFQHGNRDFLLGQDYAEEAGLHLLGELELLELNGKKILLAHGDQFCIDDLDYQNFRSMVRSPEWQQQILAKSLTERKAIARQLREKSKESNSLKAEDIMDVNPDEVLRVMNHNRCEILIHGHTHRPACHHLPENKQRIVLGDWDSQLYYLLIDSNGAIQLMHKTIKTAA